jgi:predicted nucleic acid-binding protein
VTPEAVRAEVFGGGVFIADTSARARAGHPAVREEWAAALRARQIATCAITTLELLYAARDAREVAGLEVDEATLRDIPVTVSVQRSAITALRELSRKGGAGYHRVKLPDALIAAAAQQAGIGVLHYDRHYDRLAEVLHFDSRWIAPPGTL